jgi:hypothetical protein
MTTTKHIAEYDPIVRRWRVQCHYCSYTSVRAKREASEHIIAQHVTYAHTATS